MNDPKVYRVPANFKFPRMPARFNDLAQYNAERDRGVLHEPEIVQRMAAQADFDAWSRAVLEHASRPVPRRGWMSWLRRSER